MRLVDPCAGCRDVNRRLDALERARPLERLASRVRHRHVGRNSQVEEEIRGMRRARRAPAETAADRPDIRDAWHVSVGHLLLPGRQPFQHAFQHPVHPDDGVLVSAAGRERGVDERPVDGQPQPERAEMGEHEPVLGRLPEDADVGGAAVADEVAGTGGVAAVLGADGLALLRLLDLAAHGRDEHVAAEADSGLLERPHRLDVAGDRALHVRDPEPEDAALLHKAGWLEAGNAGEPRLAPRVGGVEVAVQHQRRPAARTRPGAEDVGTPLLDLLPLHLQTHRAELVLHEGRARLLRARE